MFKEDLANILTEEMIQVIESLGVKLSDKCKENIRNEGTPYYVQDIEKRIKEDAEYYISAQKELNEPVMDL